MTDETPAPRKPASLDEVLNAMRTLWVKLDQVEKKLDAMIVLPPPPAQMKQVELVRPKQTRKPNPMHTLLQGRLLSVWSATKGGKYGFAGRDAKAIADLLKRATSVDVLVARWTYAIKHGCDSIFSFEMNFNKWDPSVGSNRPVVEGATDLYAEKK